MSVPNDNTQYGFTWGQVEVTRIMALPDGYKCLRVAALDGQSIEVYVSPKGKRIRVFKAGRELRP